MKGTQHFPKLQHYGNLPIRLFSVTSKTLDVGGGVLPLCREAADRARNKVYKECNTSGPNLENYIYIGNNSFKIKLNFHFLLPNKDRGRFDEVYGENLYFTGRILAINLQKTCSKLFISNRPEINNKRRDHLIVASIHYTGNWVMGSICLCGPFNILHFSLPSQSQFWIRFEEQSQYFFISSLWHNT